MLQGQEEWPAPAVRVGGLPGKQAAPRPPCVAARHKGASQEEEQGTGEVHWIVTHAETIILLNDKD